MEYNKQKTNAFLAEREENMALIKCPECNHDVSTTAAFCPNCGYKLQSENPTRETAAPVYTAPAAGEPLFSTKNLYKTMYIIFAVLWVLLYVSVLIPTTVLGVGVGGAVWTLIFYFCFRKILLKQKLTYTSYVDLFKDKVSGKTYDSNSAFESGTVFTVGYEDITRVDMVANNAVIIRTNSGDYSVQAYQCAGKVKEIIEAQKAAQ